MEDFATTMSFEDQDLLYDEASHNELGQTRADIMEEGQFDDTGGTLSRADWEDALTR